jgi:hypothetical protein
MPGCNDGVTYETRLRDEFAREAMLALMSYAQPVWNDEARQYVFTEPVMRSVAETAWDMAAVMMQTREATRRRCEVAGERDGA